MKDLFAFRVKLSKGHKIKIWAGILLAAVFALGWCFCFARSTATVFLALFFGVIFLAFGCLHFEARTKQAAVFLNVLWGTVSIAAVIAVALPVDFSAGGLYKIGCNLLCAFFLTACFYAMTASWRSAVNLSVCALTLLIGANQIVYAFRGKELSFGDMMALETALSVAGQYSFEMTKRFLMLCTLCALGIFSQFAVPKIPAVKGRKLRRHLAGLLAAAVMLVTLNFASAGISIKNWDDEGTKFNGYLLNFYLGISDIFVQAPEDYSPEAVEEYCRMYEEAEATEESTYPNIIVIMDEAFADLSVYGGSLDTNIPVTPFMDSLSENVIKGYALSSVFGGRTANSEFEFLTGHTMGFLPENSVPYQQYLFDDVCSIAWVLRSYGYSAFATHPFRPTGWSRSTVYPYLGLEDFTFIEDYPSEDLVRSFVSDQEMFEYVMDHLKDEERESPLFLMGITMQNHGGYLYEGEDFTQTVQLEGLAGEYPKTEQYLSLLRETDRAVEYLLEELQAYPEETIVLFFGDHQPDLEKGLYQELIGDFDTLDKRMLQYMVPFFIWANFDIEEAYVDCTSLNYLPRYLLETAGLELPVYYQALADIEDTIPAINAMGYYSSAMGRFAAFDEAEGAEAEQLKKYELLQYNALFDEENRNYELFGQYMMP